MNDFIEEFDKSFSSAEIIHPRGVVGVSLKIRDIQTVTPDIVGEFLYA
jgi:hypothetical protein